MENKSSDEALYHLRKIIGLNQSVQKHIDALRELGVGMYDVDSAVEILWGLEKFGIPIINSQCRYIECCDTVIYERAK